MSDKKDRTPIWVAVIGLVGVVFAALVSKCGQSAPSAGVGAGAQPSAAVTTTGASSRLSVDVSYFPGRENDAMVLADKLRQRLYSVNTRPADADVIGSAHKHRSYLFYHAEEQGAMSAARIDIEAALGHALGTYTTAPTDDQDKGTLNVVLTEAK